MRRTTVIATAVLALPATASADDAGIVSAYTSHRAGELAPALKTYARDRGRIRHTPAGRVRPVLRALIRDDRGINTVLGRISSEVRPQTPSSAAGTRAKRAVLREVAGWVQANRLEVHGLHAWIAGHKAKAQRLLDRANRTMVQQTYPAGKRASKALREAGFAVKALSA